ncbi:DUF2059 domain-containing protein [Sphingomonas sp. SUN039]|uniref:DUF2059 domain-containing protein n=1 Tax=Sphingomonas sp. SUN039 TaxID=2937787 RepID=UPI00216400AF|nr:DUF2059 domain-containing protein [Sphingomonas sp. SUN039]UVO55337.1 DUF2059 domain-containing protein [Sphingomonas sp. SUN039]
MKTMIALATLALATPLSAQTVVATHDAPPAAAPSPVATDIAAKLFPDGTYRKMLGDTFSKMMSGMIDQMGNMPLGDLVKAYGLDTDAAAKLDKATVNKVMAILDPAFKERMRLVMDGMFKGMIPLFEKMEPDLRAGLAESLAHRFTPAELGELKTFFATPTGNSFAGQQMLLFMDPAVMGRMQAQMPKIMEAMPTLVGAAAKAAASLPKAKKYADLTEAERAELAALLGIDPKKMKK